MKGLETLAHINFPCSSYACLHMGNQRSKSFKPLKVIHSERLEKSTLTKSSWNVMYLMLGNLLEDGTPMNVTLWMFSSPSDGTWKLTLTFTVTAQRAYKFPWRNLLLFVKKKISPSHPTSFPDPAGTVYSIMLSLAKLLYQKVSYCSTWSINTSICQINVRTGWSILKKNVPFFLFFLQL